MKKTIFFFLVVCAVCIFMTLIFSQQSKNYIPLEQVMTPQEMKTTGVENLLPAQRATLEQLLYNYTMKIRQFYQKHLKYDYLDVGSGHWIKRKVDGGKLIILEDNSIWEIHSLDRIYTTLWLPLTNMTIIETDSPIGDYKYLLINTDDGEKALAKYMGK